MTPPHPDFSILIVDDEPSWLRSMSITLERSGMNNIITLNDSREVTNTMNAADIGIILLDLNMPDISGMELIEIILERYPETVIIIVSGMNQVENAVSSMKLGASDYLVKTESPDRIITSVTNAITRALLSRENRSIRNCFLPHTLKQPSAFSSIITQNSFMLSIFGYIEAIASSTQPILVTGDSGTGKELVAQTIHELSKPDHEWIAVNVAGLDDAMFSDTLFGHSKGAFTGAVEPRRGMIDSAGNGTLFLDEIGDLSLLSQVKLLRLIQEKEYFPVGSDTPKISGARIVCATHHNLLKEQQAKKFRKDLYYRLHTHHIHLPPLQDRKDDIPLLLDHFLSEACIELGKKIPAYPKQLPVLLATYHFPGNVRELKAMVFDAIAAHSGGMLSMRPFKSAMEKHGSVVLSVEKKSQDNPFEHLSTLPTLTQTASLLVNEAMNRSNGNQSIAAKLLGISQPALSKRLKQAVSAADENPQPS